MKINILVVDDEVEIVNSVKVLLQSDDRIIHSADNGTNAMEILKSQQIDCIVSDIYMPNMDGMMLIKEIRAINNKVPVIFFTGFGNEKLLKEALSFGAYDFIEKPGLDDLCRAVDECIAGLSVKTESGMLNDFDAMMNTEKK